MNNALVARLPILGLAAAMLLVSACGHVSQEQLSAVEAKATSAMSDARKAASDAANALKAAQAAQATADTAAADAAAAKSSAEAAMSCCNAVWTATEVAGTSIQRLTIQLHDPTIAGAGAVRSRTSADSVQPGGGFVVVSQDLEPSGGGV